MFLSPSFATSRLFLIGAVGWLIMLGALSFDARACEDVDDDGYFTLPGCGTLVDCNDTDWGTHPINLEACNAIDDNCDGTVDEGCAGACASPEPVPQAHSVNPLPGGSQYSPRIARGLRSVAVTRANWDPVNCYQIAVTVLDEKLQERAPPILLKALAGRSAVVRESVIAWVGDRYIVAWQEGQADANCSLVVNGSEGYYAAIAPDGSVLYPATRLACLESPGASLGPISIAAMGDTAAIAFTQGNGTSAFNGTWLTRIDKEGRRLNGCGVKLTGQITEGVSVASNGTEFGVSLAMAVSDAPPWAAEIFFRRYTAELQPIDAAFRRMTFDTTRSAESQIAWGPGEWAIAWTQDFVDGYQDIGFMRVNPSGDLITPPGIVKATSGAELPGANDRLNPSLAWTGGEYGIAYHENSNVNGAGDIKLSRMSQTGVDLGPDPVLTPDMLRNAMFAKLVWNGLNYTMTWQDRTTASGPYEALVQKIGCNCTDSDHDGFSTCRGDCDDTRFQVRPVGTEVCGNGLDDNCDGVLDCQDAVRCPPSGTLPASPSGLVIGSDKQTISWPSAAGASRYDVARGSLPDLFVERRVASAQCLATDTTQTFIVDPEIPGPLAGFFYLVRSETGSASQCLVSGWGVANETEIDACP
ncbi:MAG: putative metal-binding motif-containing protein [Acidobacteriota bacterium]